jgi:hypothetical protein
MKAIYSRQVSVLMLPLLLLVAGALLFTGCESDPVAPHEDAPALTEEDVAYQAMYLGQMFNEVGVRIVSNPSAPAPNKVVYTYTFPVGSPVAGVITMDYRLGGADGASAAFDAADYAHLYTSVGDPLVLSLGLGGTALFTFDLQASMVQATNTATVLAGSVGSFTSGDYTADFAFNNVVVTLGSDYPLSGSMIFTTTAFELELTYDGDNTAELAVGGVLRYIVNLDDGTLTEVV